MSLAFGFLSQNLSWIYFYIWDFQTPTERSGKLGYAKFMISMGILHVCWYKLNYYTLKKVQNAKSCFSNFNPKFKMNVFLNFRFSDTYRQRINRIKVKYAEFMALPIIYPLSCCW